MKLRRSLGLSKRFSLELEICVLEPEHEAAYEELLKRCSWSMIYHSLEYRNFLKGFLADSAEDIYLLCFKGGALLGALPCFLMKGELGNVVNSLPFFGSHGSVLLCPEASEDVACCLFKALQKICEQKKVLFSVVVENPFRPLDERQESVIAPDFTDQRIGQFTELPRYDDQGKDDIERSLFALYHQKTRNMVRKAKKSGLKFEHDSSAKALSRLCTLHRDNMSKIGGVVKPKRFFDVVTRCMSYDLDYRVYVAVNESEEIVSALLILYYLDTVEYFVPAIADEWRHAQPLSGLIHQAMLDAVTERKSKYWNWGGTWLAQDGVYRFKSRWGTRDYPYKYYIKSFIDKQKFAKLKRAELLDSYPWFYTIPFSELEKE